MHLWSKLLFCDIELRDNLGTLFRRNNAHFEIVYKIVNCCKIFNSQFSVLGHQETLPTLELQKLEIVYKFTNYAIFLYSLISIAFQQVAKFRNPIGAITFPYAIVYRKLASDANPHLFYRQSGRSLRQVFAVKYLVQIVLLFADYIILTISDLRQNGRNCC